MNTAELRAAIARTGKTNRSLAEGLGISEQAFYNKIQGLSDFKSSEIKRLAIELCLNLRDINIIFFDKEVN